MTDNEQQSNSAEEVEVQVNDVQEENIDYKEAWIRATADYQNLKKEVADKQAEYVKYANQNMLEDLLPVIEHFHQGLKYVPEEVKSENWMQGFVQIKKQLDEFMTKNGLERIETVGMKFNPDMHEAVQNKVEEGKEPGEILQEVMGGYKLHGKVLQAARVIVAE